MAHHNGYAIISFPRVIISEFSSKDDDENCKKTPIAFSDVSCLPLALGDDVLLTSSSDGRERNMLFIPNALKRSLKSVEKYFLTGFICHGPRHGS